MNKLKGSATSLDSTDKEASTARAALVPTTPAPRAAMLDDIDSDSMERIEEYVREQNDLLNDKIMSDIKHLISKQEETLGSKIDMM